MNFGFHINLMSYRKFSFSSIAIKAKNNSFKVYYLNI